MSEDAVTAEAAVEKLPLLHCVASTGDSFRGTVDQAHPGWAEAVYGTATPSDRAESNCFRHALLSADGTALVTYNEDLIVRTFAVPSIQSNDQPAPVTPYCSAPSPSKISSLALHPSFDICNPATTLLLTAQPDLPLRLTNALDFAHTHASYRWQNPLTEAYIAPSSLLFVNDTNFVAGAWETIAVFDLHNGGGPVYESQTRKGRKARKLYGADTGGIGGLVSALAVSADAILAAGTYNRQVALYENAGQGECMTAFDLGHDRLDDASLKGNGVSQLAWSSCGRYLFVAERQSDALLVYDVRHTGRRLSYLVGRRALTTLKLSFDLAGLSNDNIDVWAGGTDGKVRIWQNVTAREGRIEPDLALYASQAAVSNTILSRRDPTMLITTSGQRLAASDLLDLSDSDSSASEDSEDSDESESDSSVDGESGDQSTDVEEPISDIPATVAAEDAWRGPAFDNTLAFWQIL